jgi:SAM-dependent methyltransferase
VGKENEIVKGDLFCGNCHSNYPVLHYIPRFVNTDKYVHSFSTEWTMHRDTQLDSLSGTTESEDTFKQKTGFDLHGMKGALVLDAGCGAGRFTEIAAKYGAEVIGVDMSFSVDAAFESMGLKKNIHLIQADIFQLPFSESVFEYIFSIGVLHHTPSTKDAFCQLAHLLKEHGEIAIWVYPDEPFSRLLYNRISDFYRVFTTRMPWPMLYFLCHISVPLFYLERVKGFGKVVGTIFPCSNHPNPRWRVLDTFDWYSPKYQWKHTWKEVVGWFEGARLTDIVRLDVPISVKGRR